MLFEAIRQTKCGLEAFDLLVKDATTVVVLKGTPLEFWFEPFGDTYEKYITAHISYGAGYRLVKHGYASEIKVAIVEFKTWLKSHAQPCFEDHNTIDLWAEYKNGVQYFKIDDLQTTDLTYFSQDDIVRIGFAIEDLKALIPEKFNITHAQIEMVNQKLDYLVDVARRAPKTDWKGVAVSMVLTIIVALSLDTARGNQLWELFMQVFRVVSMLPGSSL